MTEPWRLSSHQCEQAIFTLWPELATAPPRWVEDGWDFRVAIVDNRWVVRVARNHAAALRLAREVHLLHQLVDSPVPLPRYRRVALGMAVYPFITGTAVSAVHPPTLALRRELGAFIEWLHARSQPQQSGDVRRRWAYRRRALYRQVKMRALDLFSVKEARRIKGRFEPALTLLAESDWCPALLHGDLTAENILQDGGQLVGILDFGDWRWGDEAFDWSAVPGMEMVLPDRLAGNAEARARMQFYRFTAPFYGILRGLKLGQVEVVEHGVRRVRRLLSE